MNPDAGDTCKVKGRDKLLMSLLWIALHETILLLSKESRKVCVCVLLFLMEFLIIFNVDSVSDTRFG